MQKITVRLPIENVPDDLRESLRKAGITTLPPSVSVTVLAENGDEITTLYGVEALPSAAPATIIKQEIDERNEVYQQRHPQTLQQLREAIKDEKLWLTQEMKFLSREDSLIRGMDVRSPDYQRRKEALKARRAKYAKRCKQQCARRQQIMSGNARGSGYMLESQQRLPPHKHIVQGGYQPPPVHRDYSSVPLLPPPPGVSGLRDFSSTVWIPPPPPPLPSSQCRPYQPGLFDFDKFIPSYARPRQTEYSNLKYVEPPKSFTFPIATKNEPFAIPYMAVSSMSTPVTMSYESHRLNQPGAGIHPARLALLQSDKPETDDMIFKTEGDIDFPSSSVRSRGSTSERTGANMEPLARKRPSPSKNDESSSKRRASPFKMGEWVVEASVTPAKFRPAPTILHGYGHSYAAPVSLHDFCQPLKDKLDIAPRSSTTSAEIQGVKSPSLAEQLVEIEKAIERMENSSGVSNSGIKETSAGLEGVSIESTASKAPLVLEPSVPDVTPAGSSDIASASARELSLDFASSKVPFFFERSISETTKVKLSENISPVEVSDNSAPLKQNVVFEISEVRQTLENKDLNII